MQCLQYVGEGHFVLRCGAVARKGGGNRTTEGLGLDGHVTTVRQGLDVPGYFKNEIFSMGDWLVGPSVVARAERQWLPTRG